MSKTETPISRPSFLKAFAEHPASVGETYLQHALFATRFAFTLFGAGLAALIHAFVPPLFETSASKTIERLHRRMKERH